MQLKVIDIIGKDIAVNSDDAEGVFKIINSSFEKKERITLDFSGIDIINTAFLNTAIGQLYSKYSDKEIKSFLKINPKTISESDIRLLYKVIMAAQTYFANKKKLNESYDNIL